jgi:hypothetical protein
MYVIPPQFSGEDISPFETLCCSLCCLKRHAQTPAAEREQSKRNCANKDFWKINWTLNEFRLVNPEPQNPAPDKEWINGEKIEWSGDANRPPNGTFFNYRMFNYTGR